MSDTPQPDERASRRAFLKGAGVGAAGLVVGGGIGGLVGAEIGRNAAVESGLSRVAKRSVPGFQHVVVLMYENRSFDNLLGWLYKDEPPRHGQKFEGLQTAKYSNKAPDGTVVDAHVYTGTTDEIMSSPNPDPGEFYPHVNTQLFNVIDPPSNADIRANGISAPYNLPANHAAPTMSGFVTDYIVNFRDEKGREPTPAEYAVAMGGFSPDMLPVFSTLARGFGVYDHWFASVPSQTFCNRSFFHANTSHGFVTNKEGGNYDKWLGSDYAVTVFNRLEDAGISWRVYYDEAQMVSFTGILHAPSIQQYWISNFRGMSQFHEDAKNGNLPAYSFIEPRMIFNHNDMHPPFGHLRHQVEEGDDVYNSAFSDVRAGEALLASVYTAIRESSSGTGSNALNTALVVTFDEHGGTYDHVAPPVVTTPSGKPESGEMGFGFDRLGCRVPALIISAHTAPGTVINDKMQHSSVSATLNRLHGLVPLSHRDDAANDLFNAVNLPSPRHPDLWPDVHPAFVPPNPESVPKPHEAHASRPLSPPAEGLLGLLLAKYDPKATVPTTYAEAYDVLVTHGRGLFGINDFAPLIQR